MEGQPPKCRGLANSGPEHKRKLPMHFKAPGKIGIILQARMGSTRLPGKVIRQMAGKPLIQWCVEQLRLVKAADQLIVATSTDRREQPLIDFLKDLRVEVFRGSESDVLDRFYQCSLAYGLCHIVRATGDNPMVDPDACDALIDLYLTQRLDYANAFPQFGSGYPTGAGVEIFSFAALNRSWQEGHRPNHREHVNEYILEHQHLFKIGVLQSGKEVADAPSLTVDTQADFDRVECLLKRRLMLNS